MILLYTSINVFSLAVWLLKGFIDENPAREYEEAAMIDGYTRLFRAFREGGVAAGDDRGIAAHRDLLP